MCAKVLNELCSAVTSEMSGRWSLQASSASQHQPSNFNRCSIGHGWQSVAPQVPRRSWPVHGSWSTGVLGDHHTGTSSSRRSCTSSTPAAQAAVVVSGTAVHVTDSLAYHDANGTTNIASHSNSRKQQQQQRLRQQQDIQQQQALTQPYVIRATGGQAGINASSTAAHHGSNGKLNSSNPASISSASMTADCSLSHTQGTPAADATEPLKYHITRCIKRCRCWQEVDVVVREYGPAFNMIHISAAITHLAQLSTGQPQQLQQVSEAGLAKQQQQLEGEMQVVQGISLITRQMDRQHKQLQLSLLQHRQQPHQARCEQQQQLQLVQHLVDQAVLRLPEAGSRQVANMLWALAQLQYPWKGSAPATAAVAALTQAAAPLFLRADAQQLFNMAYAAAKMQLPVDKVWLASLQAAWLQLVQQVQVQEQDSSSCGGSSRQQSGSISSRNYSSQHSNSSSQHSSRRTRQSEAAAPDAYVSPQAAANMMWALVHLQQQPSTEWLQQVVAATVGNLLEWPARSVAVFMWGCAKLGYHIEANGTAHASIGASEQQSGQSAIASTQQVELQQAAQKPQLQLSQAESASLHQQHQQQTQDISAMLLQALTVHSKGFSCQDVCQVLWAAAMMGLQLPAPLLQQLLAASGAQLLVQQGPLQASMAKFRSSSGNGRPHNSSNASGSPTVAHSASLLLYSLARMGVMPQQQLPPLLLRPWLAALLASSHSADSHSLASAAWAICKLGLAASCPLVVKALLEAAQSRLQQSYGSSKMQELEAKQVPAEALQSGVHAAEVSTRAVASLMRAAAYCTVPSPAAAVVHPSATACAASARDLSTNVANRQHHLASASHREYLRQRQQQQLWLMLQGIRSAGMQQAATCRGVSGRPEPAHVQCINSRGGSASGKTPSAAHAIPAAALRMLLTAAGIPPAQPGSGDEQQHLQQIQADFHRQLAVRSLQQWPPSDTSAPQKQKLPEQLVLEVLPGASMMDLSQVLWAASSMNLQLPKPWWQRCILQLQQLLQQQQQQAAQSLVLSVWALGKARVLVPCQLMQELQQASLPLLQPSQHDNHHQQQLHHLTPQGHAMLLVGLVRLCMVAGHQLPASRQPKQQWQVRAAKKRSKQLKHEKLSRVVQTQASSRRRALRHNGSKAQAGQQHWHILQQLQEQGFAVSRRQQLPKAERTARRLQQRRWRFRQYLQLHQHYWVRAAGLSPDWLQVFCMSAAHQLSSFTPTGLTALLWALGKLRYHPGTSFLSTALQCVEQQLPHMNARHIALLLWSVQRLQHIPGDKLLSAVMQAWERRLASASKADSQQVLWVQLQMRQMQSRQKLTVWEEQQ